MSEDKINIQLELDIILTAIRNGDNEITAEIMKKLLLADYEIFNNISQMSKQVAQQQTTINELSIQVDKLLPEDEIEDLEEDELIDADDVE